VEDERDTEMDLSCGDLSCGYRRLFKEDGHILKVKVKISFVLFSILIIFSIGLLIYSNTFTAEFHFDDYSSIAGNLSIRNIGNLRNIWNFWPTRFITYLSLALNYHWGDSRVFGYHVFNFLAHLICTLLVWWFVILTFKTPLLKKENSAAHRNLIAFFASAIFLLHPIQSQPVDYIIQRACLLATLFFVASLCLYIKARLKQEEKAAWPIRSVYYGGSLLTAVLAIFSKEMALTFPLVLGLYEFYFFKVKKSSNAKFVAPFFIIILLLFLTMFFTHSIQFKGMYRIGEDPVNMPVSYYFLTQLKVMVTYVRLLFIPLNLNFYYDYPLSRSLFEIPVIFSCLFLSCILWAGVRLFSKYRLVSFGIFWFFITLLPESSIIPIRDVIFEHRLYLPMVGFSLFAAGGSYYLFKEKRIRAMVVVLSLLVVCYSILSYQRNKVWKDEITLWEDVVRKSPHNAKAYVNRGNAYASKDNFDQAFTDYSKAIEIEPNEAQAYTNRGSLYPRNGSRDQAFSDYNKAIELRPNAPEAYFNRGSFYFEEGKLDQAISDYNTGIKINPNFAGAYENRGIAYQKKGDFDQALSDYSKVIEMEGGHAQVYSSRAYIYLVKSNFDQALSDYSKAIEIEPGRAELYNNRAVVYFNKKEYAKSWEDVHRAEMLGYKVSPGFIEQLKKDSGRQE
jgi:tetratricopeptide (TPR) repeat protein